MGSHGESPVVGSPQPHHGDLPVEILESKLYGPAIRPGVAPRPQERPFTWMSPDAHDDPLLLLTHIADAPDRISPLPPETFSALRSPERAALATTGAGRRRRIHGFR